MAAPADQTPTDRLVAAVGALVPGQMPASDGLRSAWSDLGSWWAVKWSESFARDVRLAASDLDAAAASFGEDGVVHIEHALWRIDAAFEKFHDIAALTIGVAALQLNKNKRGVRRFESDRRANRTRLRELADQHPVAHEILRLDESINNHRALELRHQMTHSLAPILEWQSLVWFEVGEVDDKGHVLGYTASHLTPSKRLQGETPGNQLYARAVSDGNEIVALLHEAAERLADLLAGTQELPPPQALWRVMATGEVFLDQGEASSAARDASGYISPFE